MDVLAFMRARFPEPSLEGKPVALPFSARGDPLRRHLVALTVAVYKWLEEVRLAAGLVLRGRNQKALEPSKERKFIATIKPHASGCG